jgi:hypothetical protein
MNAQHLPIDELADAAEGLLDPERATVATLRAEPAAPCEKRWLIG